MCFNFLILHQKCENKKMKPTEGYCNTWISQHFNTERDIRRVKKKSPWFKSLIYCDYLKKESADELYISNGKLAHYLWSFATVHPFARTDNLSCIHFTFIFNLWVYLLYRSKFPMIHAYAIKHTTESPSICSDTDSVILLVVVHKNLPSGTDSSFITSGTDSGMHAVVYIFFT